MDDPEINDHVEPSVFGEEDDDLFVLPPPLASLAPPGEDIDDVQVQNGVVNLDGDNEAGEEDKTNKTKKRAPRPRVILNETRLCSKKGVAALKNVCSDVALKGKGHEASDLNQLLQRFEHWAQCLMPSLPFENVVMKCEKLGTKRSVQNELKRLRQDEDDVLRGDLEDEQDEEAGTGETSATGQQAEQEPEVVTQESPVQLTDEQLERIRKSRELAFARREALKKRRTEESQNESQATEDSSEDHNLNDRVGTPSTMPATDQNDIGTDKQAMDESPTRESYQLDLFSDEEDIAKAAIDKMDTDITNVKETSVEQPTKKSPTRQSNQHNCPFNDDNEIEGASIDQMDIDPNIEEISAEEKLMEKRESVEKNVLNDKNYALANLNDRINQIESLANTGESLEIQRETRVLTEKPVMENSRNEYPEEVAVGENGEDTNETAAKLPVEDNQQSSEIFAHSDKENEEVDADETDHKMTTDLAETSAVKIKDTRTTENPDMKIGKIENHDIITDEMNTSTGTEEIKL